MAAIALASLVLGAGIGPCAGPAGEAEAAAAPRPVPVVAAQADAAPVAREAPPQASVTPAVTPPSANARLEDERNTIEVFEAAAAATVFVTQKRVVRDLNMRALEVPAGSGTGFIWDEEGHVVTNYHVVDTGRARGSFAVTLYNQRTYDAALVGAEPKRDIAVLKIDAPAEELAPIRVLGPDGSIDVGQKTIAIGNPFGLDHTLTTGVVSAKGREVVGYGGITIRDMIQTDASINPGNSGGPLLDSRGRLIGMNTMIFSKTGASAGIGFAVPVTTIRRIVPQLITHGKVERAGMGITFLDDAVAARAGIKGVIITGVMRGSPAARAGLVPLRQTRGGGIVMGDVLVGVDAATIESYDDLYNALERYKAGDTVTVKILRDGAILRLPIELVKLD
ncbi:MAG: trypsin-like peptidase domain-containing protein [Nannocystaceae bacterium]